MSLQGVVAAPAEIAPSLRLLACGLSGVDLQLQPRGRTPAEGPPPRPVLTSTHLLLPDATCLPQGADAHALRRAAVAHAAAHLRFSRPGQPSKGLKPMTVALISALEDARVERLMLQEHPGMQGWFVEPLRQALQAEGTSFAALLSRMDLALMDAGYADEHYWVQKARRLFEAHAVDLRDEAALRQIAMTLVHDLGQTRVPFRAQQHGVAAAYRDDHSFLWTHPELEADPPPEMVLELARPAPQTRAKEAPPQGSAPPLEVFEVALSQHLYPEWDHQRGFARQDWCTVVDKAPAWRPGEVSTEACPQKVPPMALQRARSLSGGQRQRRQREGDELDLNAVIEFMVEHRAQRSAESRLFIRLAAADTPASILLLLDLSASTNDALTGSEQTFLDLEKQAALMLAQAVLAGGDRIAVHGFSSDTRAEVSYYRLLDFGTALDGPARAAVAWAPGRHSTRLGAALRHATSCLADEVSDLKAIVVLTDGAPSDIDVHEPRYLVEDARQAVLAARAAGVQVHCVAVDRQADTYVRRIFGWRHHHIVDNPLTLSNRLCGLYRWLAAA